VPVHFTGPTGDKLRVTVAEAQCDLPCTLYLRPGDALVRVSGDAEFERGVTIPSSEASVEIVRGNNGVKIAGFVLFAIGGIDGIYLLATDKDASEMTLEEAEQRLYIAIGGLIFTVTGAIMILASGHNGAEVKPYYRSSASNPGVNFRGFDAKVGSANDVQVFGRWTF
jgi:hypothetical protein